MTMTRHEVAVESRVCICEHANSSGIDMTECVGSWAHGGRRIAGHRVLSYASCATAAGYAFSTTVSGPGGRRGCGMKLLLVS